MTDTTVQSRPSQPANKKPSTRKSDDQEFLYASDPKCQHDIVAKWSGIECRKCGGWFCC